MRQRKVLREPDLLRRILEWNYRPSCARTMDKALIQLRSWYVFLWSFLNICTYFTEMLGRCAFTITSARWVCEIWSSKVSAFNNGIDRMVLHTKSLWGLTIIYTPWVCVILIFSYSHPKQLHMLAYGQHTLAWYRMICYWMHNGVLPTLHLLRLIGRHIMRHNMKSEWYKSTC